MRSTARPARGAGRAHHRITTRLAQTFHHQRVVVIAMLDGSRSFDTGPRRAIETCCRSCDRRRTDSCFAHPECGRQDDDPFPDGRIWVITIVSVVSLMLCSPLHFCESQKVAQLTPSVSHIITELSAVYLHHVTGLPLNAHLRIPRSTTVHEIDWFDAAMISWVHAG